MTTDTTQGNMGLQAARPAEVATRRSQGQHADLIDVRTPAEYAEVHAEGAKLFPLDVLDPKAVMSDRNGSSREPLFVICKTGGRSAKAVEKRSPSRSRRPVTRAGFSSDDVAAIASCRVSAG